MEREYLGHQLDSSGIVKVPRWWTWLDGKLGVDLTIEPRVIIGVSWQSRYKVSLRASFSAAHSHARGRTTMITIYPSPLRVQVESVEHPKPCRDCFRPPDRLEDVELTVVPYNSLFIAGHPFGSELVQKMKVRCEGRVEERNITAGVVELAQLVTIS